MSSIYKIYKNKTNKQSQLGETLEETEKYNKRKENKENSNNDDNSKNIKNKEEKEKKDENNTKKEEIINIDYNDDTEELSESIKNLLLDKEFSAPVVVKKENKLITDYHYVTFKNSYGENTCYINVILHLLYSIDELEEFLTSLYKIDKDTKSSNNEKNKNSNNIENIESQENKNENSDFLISLGKILDNYDEIISESNDKNKKKKDDKNQVTVIKTLKMRKILEKLSNNKFPLNTIADPVELFSFILEILTENLSGDTHKTFYLELIDEYICNKPRCAHIQNKYDKDNFMYHIYIDDILNYIQKKNLKVNNYRNKLFEISYKSFIAGNSKICEKCKGEMNHNLICNNCPDYILINCVWRESNPIVDDVLTVLFLMSLKDELNNLFKLPNKSHKKYNYHLFGFILYSFTLSHYIICKYNIDKNVFVLLDDEIAKEYNNLFELITGITVDVLKSNGKAFFYPVMMIYTGEEQNKLYNYHFCKNNLLNESDYQNIIKKCNEAIYEYQSNSEVKNEYKSDNYQKLIKEQQEIEEQIKKRAKKEAEKKKKKEDNKLKEGKIESNEQINIEKEKYINKEKEENKDNLNEFCLINDDKNEDNKNQNVKYKNNEKEIINNSKEIYLNNEKSNNRSNCKKKEKDEIKKNENQNLNIENNISSDIQKNDLDNKKKNKKSKKKSISNKIDINEKIWNKNEENNIENKEENQDKRHKIKTSKTLNKKETLQKNSNKGKGLENDSLLGKKINKSNQQSDRYNYNYKEGNNGKYYYNDKEFKSH